MRIDEASEFFKSLLSDTHSKSEQNIYENFIEILNDLKNRKLTEKQLQSMEEKLEFLNLEVNPLNKNKYYRLKLSEFKKYLKDKFTLISQGYYTAIGVSLGVAFGAAFGSLYGMGIGVAFGMIIGLIIGVYQDYEARKQNRVLK
jgi:ABC-type phosphate transport system permease subunit